MIHTLLHFSKNLNQNTLPITKDSDEKAKGFTKVECHKCLLILNATVHDSSEDSPSKPTEFCIAFLPKTTVYRAKEALHQGLKASEEIIFTPSAILEKLDKSHVSVPQNRLYRFCLCFHRPLDVEKHACCNVLYFG